MPTLSIVTPTFNRATLLKRCFDSLCAQTCKDFEWIIVDDGSTDGTQELVEGFSADFPIICQYKENGGKHTALNASHDLIHGEYVLILDSDDYLVDIAVEQVLAGWTRYSGDSNIGLVVFLKGERVSCPSCWAEDENVPVDIMRYRKTCAYASDSCEVIRTDLFKLYPFPVFEGENFVSEGALWFRVSFSHKCVYINKVIYIANYLEGGLTKSGKSMRIQNPHGGMYTANLSMSKKNYLLLRIKNGLLYTCYGCFAGMTPREMATGNDSKVLMYLCFPAGKLLHWRWKRLYL